MNIGNLIKSKVNTSSFNNMKELHEAMKDIMGEGCCAYNTFTDSLNKNKELTSSELLTLSVLLDIDLNTIAMHYVNTQSNLKNGIKSTEDYKLLERNILNVLNVVSFNTGRGCRFNKNDIALVNNKIYALSINDRGDSVLAYEIVIKKQGYNYVFKINRVANFNYFKRILHNSNISLEEFKEMDLLDKFNFTKNESKTYYEVFPNMKEDEILIDFEEFKENMLTGSIEEYLMEHSDMLCIDKNGKIYCDEELSDYSLRESIINFVNNKFGVQGLITQSRYDIGEAFRRIAPDILGYEIPDFEILEDLYKVIRNNKIKANGIEDCAKIKIIELGDVLKSKFGYYKLVEEYDGEIGSVDILLIECDEDGSYESNVLEDGSYNFENPTGYINLKTNMIENNMSLRNLVEELKLVPIG